MWAYTAAGLGWEKYPSIYSLTVVWSHGMLKSSSSATALGNSILYLTACLSTKYIRHLLVAFQRINLGQDTLRVANGS